MSFFERDLKKEQQLSLYLDEVYTSLHLDFNRNTDINLQHRGVDLSYFHNGATYYIDEKAQLDYINTDLPTFTFELSYLKEGVERLGWLLDKSKITTHYFLITGVYAQDNTDLSQGFTSCKITNVNRKKLLAYLESVGLTTDKLNQYQQQIRVADKKEAVTTIQEIDRRNGCLYYSGQLSEQPINLQLKLDFLIRQKIAKRIYPK
jgi:hypothetical protein